MGFLSYPKPITKSLILSVVLAACAATGVAGVNFIPIPRSTVSDGLTTNYVVFKNDGKEICYTPPKDWSYNGSPDGFSLRSNGINPAVVTMESIPLEKPVVFDEAQIKRLTEEVLASIPNGSGKATALSPARRPVNICGKDNVEIIITYSVYGRPMKMSVFFVNHTEELLRFKLISDKANFAGAHEQFSDSLATWSEG
jgi:hypothetical protein